MSTEAGDLRHALLLAVLALIRLARQDPVLEVREAAREAIPKTAW